MKDLVRKNTLKLQHIESYPENFNANYYFINEIKITTNFNELKLLLPGYKLKL